MNTANTPVAFNNKSFAKLYATEQGQAIWQHLNKPESVARMQAVSDVGIPALLAVERGLALDFGILDRDHKVLATSEEQSKNDSLERMCGNMVRQVLELNGYTQCNKKNLCQYPAVRSSLKLHSMNGLISLDHYNMPRVTFSAKLIHVRNIKSFDILANDNECAMWKKCLIIAGWDHKHAEFIS